MKRTAGTWVLLATLSGCASVNQGGERGFASYAAGPPGAPALYRASDPTPLLPMGPTPAPSVPEAGLTPEAPPETRPAPAEAEAPARPAPPSRGVAEVKPAFALAAHAAAEADDAGSVPPGTPPVRLVNSKRILLNYEVKDVGLSGISDVELWFTQDSRNWQKYNGPPQSRPPFVVEVTDEGLYGFTMVARSGVGLGRRPPQPGDLPQVLVEVDLTKPNVQLVGVKPTVDADARNLTILWAASDKNLGLRPINLSYAKQSKGPWIPLVNNVENTGCYHCPMPAGMPNSFFMRVEATDLVGNVGSAQTSHPILVDLSKPKVSILAVESAGE